MSASADDRRVPPRRADGDEPAALLPGAAAQALHALRAPARNRSRSLRESGAHDPRRHGRRRVASAARADGQAACAGIVSIMGVGYDKVDVQSAIAAQGAGHAHARRAQRRSGRPRAGPDAVGRAQDPQSDRYVRAGQWAEKGNMPLARKMSGRAPGHRRPGPHRQGHRQARRGLRHEGRVHRPQPAGGVSPIPITRRPRRWPPKSTSWW
jgi:hypothetical protein